MAFPSFTMLSIYNTKHNQSLTLAFSTGTLVAMYLPSETCAESYFLHHLRKDDSNLKHHNDKGE